MRGIRPHPGHRTRAEGAPRHRRAALPPRRHPHRHLDFAGGLRRSELVSLDAEHVTETEDGLRITLKRSKTDQEGEGRELGLPRGQHAPTCPVRALRAWRSAAGIDSGPLFRPDQVPGGTAHPPVGRPGGQARLPTL
jgi:integrase